MNKLVVDSSQRRAIGIAMIVAVVVGVLFLSRYFGLIAFAAILAYLFTPVYDWIHKRGTSEGTASLLTLLVSLFCIIIPLILIALISVKQIDTMLDSVDTASITTSVGKLGTSVIDSVNNLLEQVGSDTQITVQDISDFARTAVERVGTSILNFITGSLGGFFTTLTNSIIFLFVFVALLRNKNKIVKEINTLNPLGKEISQMYVDKVALMTQATVKGQFIIAILQGLACALGLLFVGFDDIFFFAFLVLTAFSFVPLGAGIITIPIGVVMILLGSVWQGVFLILWHVLFVTNIDNFLRPVLVPKKARLSPALMLLSVFSGMAIFGFLGIVLGPVLMIIIVTTFDVYLEVYHNVYAKEVDKESDGVVKKLTRFQRKLTNKIPKLN